MIESEGIQIQSNKRQLKNDYVWNTLGGLMSALASVLLLIGVTQVLGAYDGGIFAIAFAVAQQFQTIGQYETRVFQATDVKKEFSFGVYFATKIITCSIMVSCIIIYAFIANGVSTIGLIFILVGLIRFFDAFEDVFHGLFQQEGRLDLAGKAYFFRTLITTISFFIGIVLSKSLIAGCAIAVLASIAAVIAFNIPTARKKTDIKPAFKPRLIKKLLLSCFPLFLGSFFFAYISNAPKYGIEFFMNPESQTYFAILFMPAMVINMIGGFLFKPLLTSMAKEWHAQNRRQFIKYIIFGFLASFGITLISILIAWPIGTPILSTIYGVDVNSFSLELIVLLCGGGFNAASVIIYYALVVIRRQKLITLGYGLASVIITILVFTLINSFGILGAALSYLGGMIGLVFIFSIICIIGVVNSPKLEE